jgi:hypothetical protein
MPPLAAFFAGAFVPLAVLAAVALAFGATASLFQTQDTCLLQGIDATIDFSQ